MIAFGCGSGGDDPEPTKPAATATRQAARTSTSVAGSPAPDGTAEPGSATEESGAGTPAAGATAPPAAPAATQPAPPAPGGRTYTLADAQGIVQSAVLQPGDAGAGWTVMSDQTTDNASAAAADPRGGASFERCGRLTGRVLTLQPPSDQLVSRYLAGQSVSFFTNLNVYATAAGATDCGNEAAARFTEPGELAKQFSAVFVDVTAVVVTSVNYPQVGDGSVAFTLSGKINAAGTVVDLTILIVGFRKGNVAAVVGSAASANPSQSELAPLVSLVESRIAAAQ
jgi:hypothetical protein